ncbi:MAG: ribbon-helix-helix domain-containing protein [Phormidesmis sp. CAN_BIN36]|nr:ribbon-helix-helix domain-containing protein [Phormidesmis sp. CAN_BIN36]
MSSPAKGSIKAKRLGVSIFDEIYLGYRVIGHDYMEDTLTITLTPELKATLDNLTHTEGISPETLVQKAIEDYLFIRQFRALRSQLMQKTQTSYTDDDIFEMVS